MAQVAPKSRTGYGSRSPRSRSARVAKHTIPVTHHLALERCSALTFTTQPPSRIISSPKMFGTKNPCRYPPILLARIPPLGPCLPPAERREPHTQGAYQAAPESHALGRRRRTLADPKRTGSRLPWPELAPHPPRACAASVCAVHFERRCRDHRASERIRERERPPAIAQL